MASAIQRPAVTHTDTPRLEKETAQSTGDRPAPRARRPRCGYCRRRGTRPARSGWRRCPARRPGGQAPRRTLPWPAWLRCRRRRRGRRPVLRSAELDQVAAAWRRKHGSATRASVIEPDTLASVSRSTCSSVGSSADMRRRSSPIVTHLAAARSAHIPADSGAAGNHAGDECGHVQISRLWRRLAQRHAARAGCSASPSAGRACHLQPTSCEQARTLVGVTNKLSAGDANVDLANEFWRKRAVSAKTRATTPRRHEPPDLWSRRRRSTELTSQKRPRPTARRSKPRSPARPRAPAGQDQRANRRCGARARTGDQPRSVTSGVRQPTVWQGRLGPPASACGASGATGAWRPSASVWARR
jgi:hypothetical protein